MQPAPTNILMRNDTILGVCEAIGQDLGFHPNWLRVTLAGALYFAPLAVVGVYLGLGLLVAATRWIAPDEIAQVEAAAAPRPELVEAGFAEELPLAA